MITLTGVPVSASSEPACAAKATGISSCDGERRRRTAIRTTTGVSAATEALTVMNAVTRATTAIVSTTTRVRSFPTRAISAWPDERRHTGRLERLADDEERGDEEDGRVAEARQRLLQVEHARRPQRERGPDRRRPRRGCGPRRRRPRRRPRTRKVMVDWLIDRWLRPGLRRRASSLQSGRDHEHHQRRDGVDAHQSLCTGAPGPRGMPSRYQATKNSVQMIDSTRTYGSIIATTVPMPASRR